MMRGIVVIVLLLCLHAVTALSQSIRLVRSDVDSSRSHFVTATYRFGVDVKLENAGRCSAAAFELRYSNAQYVQYSGYSAGQLGRDGIIVFADPTSTTTGSGKLNVSVISNKTIEEAPQNPVIIHLDFVTTSNAPHNATSTFTFTVAQAVTDSGTVTLQTTPLAYTIRSFVSVFPGDANNDGTVDTRDWTAVAEFISGGTRYRGYKRNPASVYWQAQTALAWDSATATYADCDGSGDVTQKDALVTAYNFGKKHFSKMEGESVLADTEPSQHAVALGEYPPDAIKLPIILTSDKPYIGMSTIINWHNNGGNYRVLGIEPGTMFQGENRLHIIHIDTTQSQAEISLASPGNEITASNTEPIAFIIIQQYGPDVFPLPMLQNPYGITTSGLFFPMNASLTSVNDNIDSHGFSLRQESHSLFIRPASASLSTPLFSLSDLLGNEITVQPSSFNGQEYHINVPTITNGIYILRIAVDNTIRSYPLFITQ